MTSRRRSVRHRIGAALFTLCDRSQPAAGRHADVSGASNTELCPTRFFNGEPLYREGAAPDAAEVERRRTRYWQPYHDALRNALQAARERHGYALLWDGHSIRSQIPGCLMANCLTSISALRAARVAQVCVSDSRSVCRRRRSHTPLMVAWGAATSRATTANRSSAFTPMQMEMCQSLYMQEVPPFAYLPASAANVQPLLRQMLETMLDWKPQ